MTYGDIIRRMDNEELSAVLESLLCWRMSSLHVPEDKRKEIRGILHEWLNEEVPQQ